MSKVRIYISKKISEFEIIQTGKSQACVIEYDGKCFSGMNPTQAINRLLKHVWATLEHNQIFVAPREFSNNKKANINYGSRAQLYSITSQDDD